MRNEDNAKQHGWWDEDRTFGEVIALCHSELSEALEAYRDDEDLFWIDEAQQKAEEALDKSFGHLQKTGGESKDSQQ